MNNHNREIEEEKVEKAIRERYETSVMDVLEQALSKVGEVARTGPLVLSYLDPRKEAPATLVIEDGMLVVVCGPCSWGGNIDLIRIGESDQGVFLKEKGGDTVFLFHSEFSLLRFLKWR